MPEPLTTQLVAEELKRLHVAFPQNVGMRTNPIGTAEVYRNGLKGLSGDSVRAAVDRAIQEGEYFPKVAKIRELATEWMRRNQATADPTFTPDPLWCPVCHTRAKTRDRYRPATDELFRPYITRDGYLFLEHYQRDLCECGAHCVYEPLPDVEPLQMQANKAPRALVERGVYITVESFEAKRRGAA